MKLKYYLKSSIRRIFLFIIITLIISACEGIGKKKHLSLEEKSHLAVQLVDSLLQESYTKNNIAIFFEGQKIEFIENFHDSIIELKKSDLLFLKSNKDSLINFYGENVIDSHINYIKKSIKFYTSFSGFKIRKHFQVEERISPMAMQLFFIDTSLVLRAVSERWFTKIHIDTIDGEVKRLYVDTSEYFVFQQIWND